MKALMRKNSENYPLNKGNSNKYQSNDEMAEYFLKALEKISKLKKNAESAKEDIEFAIENPESFDNRQETKNSQDKRNFKFDPGIIFTKEKLSENELEILREKLKAKSLETHKRERLKRDGLMSKFRKGIGGFSNSQNYVSDEENLAENEGRVNEITGADLPGIVSNAYKKDVRRYDRAFHRY